MEEETYDEVEEEMKRRRVEMAISRQRSSEPPFDDGGVITAGEWAHRVNRGRIGLPPIEEAFTTPLPSREMATWLSGGGSARPTPRTAPLPPLPQRPPDSSCRPMSSYSVSQTDLLPVSAQLHYLPWPHLFGVSPARSHGVESHGLAESDGVPIVEFYRECCRSTSMKLQHRVGVNSGVVAELVSSTESEQKADNPLKLPSSSFSSPARPLDTQPDSFPIVRAVFENMMLGDHGVVPVLEVMKQCMALQKLSLRGNNLHDCSIELLITDTLVVPKGDGEAFRNGDGRVGSSSIIKVEEGPLSVALYTEAHPNLLMRHPSLTEIDLADNEFRMGVGKSLFLFFCRVGSPQIECINLHPSPMLNIGLIHKFDRLGSANTRRNVEDPKGKTTSKPKKAAAVVVPKRQQPQMMFQCFWEITFCF